MLLSDCFSGYALTTCFDFVLKLFGLPHFKREKNYTKKKVYQQTIFSPQNLPGVLLKADFKILTKFLAESSKVLSQLPSSNLLSTQSFLGLLFWTYRLQFGPSLLNFRQKNFSRKNSKILINTKNWKNPLNLKRYLWPRKTSSAKTAGGNRHEWVFFPLQLRKQFKSRRFLQKLNPKDVPLET